MNKKFIHTETAWCPGCGNHSILSVLENTLNQLKLEPSQILLVGGIGQAAKTNQYLNTNGFSGLHGRALPAAVGAKIANPKLTVIVNSGDGDSYGEGGNHWLHNIRRNADITHLVHNNQIYGLTKGQSSPTSDQCDNTDTFSPCSNNTALNPMTIAISAGATFVARGFSGSPEHLTKIMTKAIQHEGYSLVDILQPCIAFNHHNTFSWYKEHVYFLEDDYDVTDKEKALVRSLEFDNKIPLGVLYQSPSLDYHSKNGLDKHHPLSSSVSSRNRLNVLMDSFQ